MNVHQVEHVVLSNDDRKYLTLPPLEDEWTTIVLGKTTLYLEGDRIVRRIRHDDPAQGAAYTEDEIDRVLNAEHTHILPAAGRGKPVKLTEATAASKLRPSGISVALGEDPAIVNTRTGHGYPVADPNLPNVCAVSVREWLTAWKAATTSEDLADLQRFALREPRQRVKYEEGDVFAFRHSRREWGFGRVLFDRAARFAAGDIPKDQQHGYMQYLGRVVLVQVFRTLEPSPDVSVEDIVKLPALPSQMVMDDGLLRGEWPIIGHAPLEPSEIDHELLVGRTLVLDDDTWFLQDGLRYAEIPEQTLFSRIPTDLIELLGNTSFAVTASGPSLDTADLRACIGADSNAPHWQNATRDLRNPAHQAIRDSLLRAFGVGA